MGILVQPNLYYGPPCLSSICLKSEMWFKHVHACGFIILEWIKKICFKNKEMRNVQSTFLPIDLTFLTNGSLIESSYGLFLHIIYIVLYFTEKKMVSWGYQ